MGEVLFDCFPDGAHLGGAPFNVAWHLRGLGLAPRFVSRVGKDDLGEQVRTAMTGHGMETGWLQEDADRPTGQVQITLDGAGGHTFRILPEQAYDHIDATALNAKLSGFPAELAYFGSLALRAPESRKAILSAAEATDGVRFLDINLRDSCWTQDTALAALSAATVAKLNDEEFGILTGLFFAGKKADPAAWLTRFDLDGLCITAAENGATWHAENGSTHVPAPPVNLVDTVGAGDGFAAVLIFGLLSGWPPQTTLPRAAHFAAAICGQRGACPDDPGFYTPFTAAWEAGRDAPETSRI